MALMDGSINKVLMVGRLVDSPSVEKEGGQLKATFYLEVIDPGKRPTSSQRFLVISHGGAARFASKLAAGSKVHIEGYIRNEGDVAELIACQVVAL